MQAPSPNMPQTAGRAVAEVVVAVAAVHFVYKALKLIEPSGSNLAPGLTMLAATALAVTWHARDGIAWGLRDKGTLQWWPAAFAAYAAVAALALHGGLGWRHLTAVLFERGIVVGRGEELFFRGYVQSRVDAALGRPARVLGARVGVGLAVTAVLFGAIHACNPTLWFRASGLVFGWLRAVSGSVWLPAFVHGWTGVLRPLGLL